MLSRVAEAFFWIGRYVERAEYTARLTNTYENLLLEHPDPRFAVEVWTRLLDMGGDLHLYRERHGEVEPRAALEFVALDAGNPNSLYSCIAAARENARHIQDQLSSEVWHHLNGAWLDLKALARADFRAHTHQALQNILYGCYAFHGVVSNTMLHDDRLAFCRLGRDIERTQRTVRLLRTPVLVEPVGEGADLLHLHEYVAVLKAASAYEAYRKTYRAAPDPDKIVEFLLLSDRFPRAVRFCAKEMQRLLQLIAPPAAPTADGPAALPEPERLVGQFAAEMDFATLVDVYAAGLDAYLDNLVDRLDGIADACGRGYFRYAEAPGSMQAALPQRRRPFPRPEAPTTLIQALTDLRHDFKYVYASPVTNVRTVVRLVPNHRYGRQRVLDVVWHMEPKGSISQHEDAFGNQVWVIEHDRVEEAITCSVEMRVENHAVYHAEGALALRGVALAEEDVLPGMAGPADYAPLTTLADHSEGLLATAQRLAAEHPATAHLAETIMAEVARHMRFRGGVTDVTTPASRAWALGQGVCQDFTHCMLSLCRLAGLSARYISGYLPAEGAMHAWAEVLVTDPASGRELWVAYDPTHGRRADETYTTVAVGRDYQDVAPTSGFYTGTADSRLEVRVTAKVNNRRPIARRGTGPLLPPGASLPPGVEAQAQQQQ